MSNTNAPVAAIAERRAGSHQMIQKFVEERTRMLSLYSELAASHPFANAASVTDLLARFCETLIDYTADAHFRLYRYIDDQQERRGNVKVIAAQVYPVIIDTTQDILDFNDKYDAFDHPIHIDKLEDDLSVLGEKLADRIEMEDRVISALISARG